MSLLSTLSLIFLCVILKFLALLQPQATYTRLTSSLMFHFSRSLQEETNSNKIWTVHYLVIVVYLLVANLLCADATVSIN